MNKKLRIVFVVLYVTGIIICSGLYIYTNFINKSFAFENDERLIPLVLAFTLGLVKLINKSSRSSSSLSFYKHFYADIIKDSFEEDKKKQNIFLKALCLYNKDKIEKAIAILNNLQPLCETMNEKYSVNLFLALAYSDLGMQEKEVEIYESMKQAGLADSRVYSNLSIIYKNTGKYDKAYEAGTIAIQLNPSNPLAYNNMAYLYFEDGDYDAAIKNAQQCLDLKANQLEAIKLLYLVYSLQGDDQAAVYEKRALANGASKKELQEMLE